MDAYAQAVTGDAPLSFAQEGLWLTERMFPRLPQFVVLRAFRLQGELDVVALRRSLRALALRHEALRTTFVVVDGIPRQRVRDDLEPAVVERDLRHETNPSLLAAELTEQAATHRFDLETGPPLRAQLLHLADDDLVLLLSAHHIVVDLWSWPILMADLAEFYAAEREQRAPKLAPLPAGPADYAREQRARMAGDEMRLLVEHWRGVLAGVPPMLPLPTDRQRRPGHARGAGVVRTEVPADVAAAFTALAREERATPVMVTLAALGWLLVRRTGESAITVGLPVAGDRHRPEIENLVGMFVNVLPAKVEIRGEPTFRELVRQAKVTVFDVIVNQDVPYEFLVRALAPGAGHGVLPYNRVSLNVRYPESGALELPGARISAFPTGRWFPPGDLSLTLGLEGDRFELLWIYDSTLFDEATIAGLAKEFDTLLAHGLRNPDQPIDQRGDAAVPVRAAPAPSGTVTGRFAEWARRTPDALAVAHRGASLTYADLDARSDRLAHVLRAAGVRRETAVGVCMDRSIDLVVAFLAILKAGGAYVPLEPRQPASRREQMLRQTAAALVICDETSRAESWPAGVRLLDPAAEPTAPVRVLPEFAPDAALAVAYIMFTSGSTGAPKGVAITHRGILGLVVEADYVKVTPPDRFAFTASLSSDNTTFEVWGALLNGASVHVVDREVLLDPKTLADFLTAQAITVLSVASAMVNHAAYHGPLARVPLRALYFGGEAGSPAAVRALRRLGFTGAVAHTYGPTETTMLATCEFVTELPEGSPRIPVGAAISATEVYVLDEQLRVVPVGAVGELCVAGDRLALGYAGNPGLTALRFCPNPIPGRAGERVYRTGDLGRELPDGRLEVLGRMDRQVKIRGFRVEPAEVEQALLALPEVAEAAVFVQSDQDTGDARLIAYAALMPGATIAVPSARATLRAALPDYMVPADIIVLPSLPKTATGKIDQRSLPPAVRERGAAVLHEPMGAREQHIADVMADVLGLPSVGRNDDFFDLGGHSMLAVQLVERLRTAGLDMPMERLLAQPTAAGMAGEEPIGLSTRPFLVLVHGGGGGVTGYAPLLARLRGQYQCMLVEAASPDVPTLRELAQRYAAQVWPSIQGRATVVAGWSIGGALAQEMARQWQREHGVSVAVLMIDAWPGSPPDDESVAGHDPLSAFIYDLFRGLGREPTVAFDSGQEPEQALAAVLEQLRAVPGFDRIDGDRLRERFAIFRSLSEAARTHHPERYDGPVTLVEAAQSRPKADAWRPWCSTLRVVTLPGDHYSVLRDSTGALANLGEDLLAATDGRDERR